jgi:hypothetical protein
MELNVPLFGFRHGAAVAAGTLDDYAMRFMQNSGTAFEIEASGGSIGTAGRMRFATGQRQRWVDLTYGGTMTPDAAVANGFKIEPSDNSAFLIDNPTNPGDGQEITIWLYNTTGGALGTVSWGSKFRVAASFTKPADGFAKAVRFWYDSNRDQWWQITDDAVPE